MADNNQQSDQMADNNQQSDQKADNNQQSGQNQTGDNPVRFSNAGKQQTGRISLADEVAISSAKGSNPKKKYSMPKNVSKKFPDLAQLIEETESMNDDEREYWFQILPIMTDDQISKFRKILLNEKNQLQKLDKKYEEELDKLNEKHMIEWKEFESKERRKEIESAEAKAEAAENLKEAKLLKRLAEL